jgi:hypothetical protein
MDAIKLLKAGHYQIRDLLEDLCDADTDVRQVRSDLLAQVAEALEVQATIENEIFYPAFESVAAREGDLRIARDAIEESRTIIELLLPNLQDADITSEPFGARAMVLRGLVEHHIRTKEIDLFPRVKKLMSGSERYTLGERLLQRKQELLAESVLS